MEVNVLCWCDAAEASQPQGQQARLMEAAGIIRTLVGKLAYLEQHAETVKLEHKAAAVYVPVEAWQSAMAPLADQADSELPGIAEKAFQAALVWHCLHPQATVEAARVAGHAYAQGLRAAVRL